MSNINFNFNGPDSVSMELSGGRITLLTDGVETLIVELAKLRASMRPEVARQLPQAQNVSGLSDALFAVYDVAVLPGKAVSMRHPGLGWLSFLFPKGEADKLGKALLAEDPKKSSGPQIPTGPRH